MKPSHSCAPPDTAAKTMRIAAIFATMDRSPTAVACVRALAAQTRPPDIVIVADNASSDTTAADLETIPDLPFPLEVIRMAANAGNAGGVAAAMQQAFAIGIDAVWILDDDSWPRSPALAALLADDWDGQSVRHAHQIDPVTGRFTWPLRVAWRGGTWVFARSMDDLPDGALTRSRHAWTGALVSRHIHDAAGPVRADLFIRGEDEEYPLRIERAGFAFFACRNSVMDHPGPQDLAEWRMFGRRLFYERNLANWKLYYKVRNMVWIKKQYHGVVAAAFMAAAYTAAAIRFGEARRLPLLWQAACDGWHARLGKWQAQP
jgi:GT2 family glycosyltransferase